MKHLKTVILFCLMVLCEIGSVAIAEPCPTPVRKDGYVGVWEDRTYGDLFKMTLMECGEGDLLSQGCCYPVRWSVDKDGLLKCQIHTEKEEVFDTDFRYSPATDELNAVPKDGAAVLPEKALGWLKFIGKPEVDKPVAKRDESDLGPAKLERMIREKDKSLRVLASVDDLPDVWNLMQTRTAWATLDFTYPRFQFRPDEAVEDWLDVMIFTGAYESTEMNGKKRYLGKIRDAAKDDKPTTNGLPNESVKKLVQALKEAGLEPRSMAVDYVGTFSYWREDMLMLTVGDKEEADKFNKIIHTHFAGMAVPLHYTSCHEPGSERMQKIWKMLKSMPKEANDKLGKGLLGE